MKIFYAVFIIALFSATIWNGAATPEEPADANIVFYVS